MNNDKPATSLAILQLDRAQQIAGEAHAFAESIGQHVEEWHARAVQDRARAAAARTERDRLQMAFDARVADISNAAAILDASDALIRFAARLRLQGYSLGKLAHQASVEAHTTDLQVVALAVVPA